jgi:hypothetical protein
LNKIDIPIVNHQAACFDSHAVEVSSRAIAKTALRTGQAMPFTIPVLVPSDYRIARTVELKLRAMNQC